MITLVHAPRSRSSGFLWLLEGSAPGVTGPLPLLAREPLATPLWNHFGLSELFATPIVDLTGLHLSVVRIAGEAIGTDDVAAGGACLTPRAKLRGDIE